MLEYRPVGLLSNKWYGKPAGLPKFQNGKRSGAIVFGGSESGARHRVQWKLAWNRFCSVLDVRRGMCNVEIFSSREATEEISQPQGGWYGGGWVRVLKGQRKRQRFRRPFRTRRGIEIPSHVVAG